MAAALFFFEHKVHITQIHPDTPPRPSMQLSRPAARASATQKPAHSQSPGKMKRTCSITGASGCFASFINGVYSQTSESSNGFPIYAREDVSTNSGLFAEICIEHIDGDWEVKNALCRGTRRCFARVSHDGPLEAVAFLDTWVVSNSQSAQLSGFSRQPDVCLRFSGDKQARAKAPADQPPAAPGSSSEKLRDEPGNCAPGNGEIVDPEEEPFSEVLSDFFEFFDVGNCGQIDTNLLAPTLQRLDLEDHVHIVCGFVQR